LGTAETTWGQRLAVGTTILVARGTFDFVFQVKDGTLADRCNHDWPGLVSAGITGHHEGDDDEKQYTDVCESITIGLVKVEHLLCTYIFLKCVKGIFLVSI
jgi:hypothetical protein